MKRSHSKRVKQYIRGQDSGGAYYALNSAPAYAMFGGADFRDTEGRSYRIAFAPSDRTAHATASWGIVALRAARDADTGALLRPDATADDLLAQYATMENGTTNVVALCGSRGDTARLWVKLPRGRRTVRPSWPRADTELQLSLVNETMSQGVTIAPVAVHVAHTVHSRAERATGYIDVDSGLTLAMCDALLARQVAAYRTPPNQ